MSDMEILGRIVVIVLGFILIYLIVEPIKRPIKEKEYMPLQLLRLLEARGALQREEINTLVGVGNATSTINKLKRHGFEFILANKTYFLYGSPKYAVVKGRIVTNYNNKRQLKTD